MTKITRYIIIPEKKLIIEYYCGEIRIADIIELKRIQSADKNYNPGYGVIEDFRDADITPRRADVPKFLGYIIKNRKTVGERKISLLTKNPTQVVAATLFKSAKKILPLSIEVHSTLEAAVYFIGLPFEDLVEIKDWINKVKITTNEIGVDGQVD